MRPCQGARREGPVRGGPRPLGPAPSQVENLETTTRVQQTGPPEPCEDAAGAVDEVGGVGGGQAPVSGVEATAEPPPCRVGRDAPPEKEAAAEHADAGERQAQPQ